MSGPAIDLAVFARLREITGDDPAFLAELVDTYLEDGDAQIRALREAPAGDTAALVRPAHSLKSSSASVGATSLAELCRSLETDARAGQVADAGPRIEAINEAFDAARSELLASRRD